MDYRFYEEVKEVNEYCGKISRDWVFFDKRRLRGILRRNGISVYKWAKYSGYSISTLNSYLSSGRVSLVSAIKMFSCLCEDWELLLSSIELSQYEVCYDPTRHEYSENSFSKDKPFTRLYLNKSKKNEQCFVRKMEQLMEEIEKLENKEE